jgi:phenylalanyl-tRNA synthetase beta chain
MSRAMHDVLRIAGGEQASKVFNVKGKVDETPSVAVTADFINERLGLKLSLKDIAKLLENVEFTIRPVPADKNRLHVKPPFWRTDIEIPEDIVEEVGRLYGYDHLPLVLPRRDITPAPQDALLAMKTTIRNILAKAGANEVQTYSFVHGNLLEKSGQNKKEAFKLSNALSPELQYYRLSLLPSLLDKVHSNIKAGYDKFALFEIGKSHSKLHLKDGLPEEFEMTALVYADSKSSAAAYYYARQTLDYLGTSLGLLFNYSPITDKPDYAVTRPFDTGRSAYVTEKTTGAFIGIIGELTPTVRRNFKLPNCTAGFEVGTEDLLKAVQANKLSGYLSVPRFPKVEQDISLKVPADIAYQNLYDFIFEKTVELRPEDTVMSLTPLDIYENEDDSGNKHITLRLSIYAHNRTLRAEEVNNLLDEVAAAAGEKFDATRV